MPASPAAGHLASLLDARVTQAIHILAIGMAVVVIILAVEALTSRLVVEGGATRRLQDPLALALDFAPHLGAGAEGILEWLAFAIAPLAQLRVCALACCGSKLCADTQRALVAVNTSTAALLVQLSQALCWWPCMAARAALLPTHGRCWGWRRRRRQRRGSARPSAFALGSADIFRLRAVTVLQRAAGTHHPPVAALAFWALRWLVVVRVRPRRMRGRRRWHRWHRWQLAGVTGAGLLARDGRRCAILALAWPGPSP